MISPVVWAALAGLAAGIARAAWRQRAGVPAKKARSVPAKPPTPRRRQRPRYRIRGHRATEEQARAIELALTGESLKIEAAAGSGKTSTLIGIAEQRGGRGLYLAFNRAIAEEAKRLFPAEVDCRTAHSLAYQAVGHRYAARLQTPLTPNHVADFLRVARSRHGLSAGAWGALVLATLNRFLHSEHGAVHTSHAAGAPEQAAALTRDAAALWQALRDPKGRLPIGHDVYLKLWALEAPRLEVDFVLFDEAQDANGAMVQLMAAQSCQTIWVGDRHQQIYGWRGAVNAMQSIACAHTTQITQSFRFGPAIAELANAVLEHWLAAELRVRGNPKLKSRVAACEPEAILCRTNAGAVATAVAAAEAGRKVSLAGGVGDMLGQLRAVRELKAGAGSSHPELARFGSWNELQAHAASAEGAELAPLLRLSQRHELDGLIAGLQRLAKVEEAAAEVIVTTAHKSKGREWRRVRLADDFRHPQSKFYSSEEANLLYVAATRAKACLDVSGCEAAQRALAGRA